jgi:hypothetical protein
MKRKKKAKRVKRSVKSLERSIAFWKGKAKKKSCGCSHPPKTAFINELARSL